MENKIKRRVNQEARLAVMEEQLKQNSTDHATILGEVRHNCQANKDNFAKLEEMLNEALSGKADRWVEWYVKATISAIIVASLGVVIFLIQNHLTF